jgi:hypothetical protein
MAAPTPIANIAMPPNDAISVPNRIANPVVASIPVMPARTSFVRIAVMSMSVICAQRVFVGVAMKNKIYPLGIVLSATRPFVAIVAKFPFVVSVNRQCVKHAP